MRPVLAILIIAIVGVLALTACNSAEQKKPGSASAPGAQPSAAPVVADGVRRITTTELKALFDKGEVVVVDVRNADAFNTAHVPGAKLIPEGEVAARANELPKNKLIVTYCS